MDELDRNRLLARLARQFGNVIPVTETDHFLSCPVCRQFVDMRNFAEVYYHDDQPHAPRKTDG